MLRERDQVVLGQRIRQERTIFPRGQAKRIEMTIGRYDLDDGRVALLVEARPVLLMDADMVRAAEAVRYAPIVVTTLTMEGG